MSSFLCFICHSTVNADTNEDMRDKYREVVGMNLCMDSHLCYICCHVLNKLWLFRAVCLKRSLEYPVLFSEKGTLNLQRNELEVLTICSEDHCHQYRNRHMYSKSVTFHCEHTITSQEDCERNDYVKLEQDRTNFEDYFQKNEDMPDDKEISENIGEEYLNDDQNTPKNQSSHDDREEENEEFYEENGEEHETGELNNKNDDQIYQENVNSVENTNNFDDNDTFTKIETQNEIQEEEELKIKKKKSKKSKKKGYEKIILTLEQQKIELERRRKEKKYLEAEFKCFSCGLGFLFKDTYQTHMMRHEESNGEYRCVLCSLRFASLAVLRSHTAGHKERHLCLRCGTTVLPRARNTHAKKCWKRNTDVAACHLCAAMFSDSSGLQQHLKRFHQTRARRRNYACGVCANTYSNQAAVRTHMIKHINRKFNCDQCSSIFSSPYTLAQHKKKHQQVQSEQYHCDICNVSYNSRKSLLAHKRNGLNHQQSFFECPMCSRQCPNQRALTSHIESIHSGTKNYSCPQCDARYSNRKSLVRHIGGHKTNKEIKKVVCHLCGNSFKGNNKLNRHLREVCFRKIQEESADYEQNCINTA